METKWTKGPWTAIERHGQIEVSNNVEGTDICDVCTWSGSIGELLEAQANAHLIAASPDLYTACELSKAYHELPWNKAKELLITYGWDATKISANDFVIEYTERAMQKARGEQNG